MAPGLQSQASPGSNPSTGRFQAAPRLLKWARAGFPGGAVVKNPPANAGDTGWSPGPGRSYMPRSN